MSAPDNHPDSPGAGRTEPALGISGRITRAFFRSELTPLIILAGLLLGVFAVLVTPREEEPQINVTFANIIIPYPGASAVEIEQLISTPAEQVLDEIEGIEHVFSVSRPGVSVLTVQFVVGENRTDALVRLYNKIYSNQDWLPSSVGSLRPIIKPHGIDDVPVLTATLWSKNPDKPAIELTQVAHALEVELKRVRGTREVRTTGGPDRVVHVLIDPQKLSGFNIALDELKRALVAANVSADAGHLLSANNAIAVRAGTFLATADEVSQLVIGLHGGKPVYLSDVAKITAAADQPKSLVYTAFGPAGVALAGKNAPAAGRLYRAVTLSVAKKPGENAVDITTSLIKRLNELKGVTIPDDVEVTITRDYGKTANAKAVKLIDKLLFVTASVVLLVAFTMGWRFSIAVGIAVIVTLTLTLFASWAWGFTINRVSLFALIFSIGILVDDAIVVVENIHRHMEMKSAPLWQIIPRAVDEVGGPTILATFTVIAALLPMAFVTGLMGPYMSPIPINASMGMLISLFVAFVVTPWLAYKLMKRTYVYPGGQAGDAAGPDADGNGENDTRATTGGHGDPGVFGRFFARLIALFVGPGRARLYRYSLIGGLVFLMAASASLGVFQLVVLKMLPFDNKSEFQVVVDMPESASLERTSAVLAEIGVTLAKIPEVVNFQTYAGTASPIGFNGLVRQYYLRADAFQGDVQVNLTAHEVRDRKSHDIARDVRRRLAKVFAGRNVSIKVVEVPPGPPVMAPLVAEVYGRSYKGQLALARQITGVFRKTPGIIDIDNSTEEPAARLVLRVNRQRAARFGIHQAVIASAVATALGGDDASYIHGDTLKYAVPVRIEYPARAKGNIDNFLALKVRGRGGQLVPLSELVTVIRKKRDYAIYHKDLQPVVFVTADMAGELDSPLYGMAELVNRLEKLITPAGTLLAQTFITAPDSPSGYAIKWDGEWQVTYETFRDMGIAYGAGMILIYFLIVAQFRSYLVPAIIMVPIPLTIIGVMPGHALLGSQFTATSMIGMIALAGIIVRNSILLVDFINEQLAAGVELSDAICQAGAVRAKPIVLTGLAAMVGAFFILDDPIFNGLAIALIFGILVSTLLTLVVIPVVYYAYLRRTLKT